MKQFPPVWAGSRNKTINKKEDASTMRETAHKAENEVKNGEQAAGVKITLTLHPVLAARMKLAAAFDGKTVDAWMTECITDNCAAVEEFVESQAAEAAVKSYTDRVPGLMPKGSMFIHNRLSEWRGVAEVAMRRGRQ